MVNFYHFSIAFQGREALMLNQVHGQCTTLARFAPCSKERCKRDGCAPLADVCYADQQSAIAIGELNYYSTVLPIIAYAYKGIRYAHPSLKFIFQLQKINFFTRRLRRFRLRLFMGNSSASDDVAHAPRTINPTSDERIKAMTIDERVTVRLETRGVDLQSDEGAARYQEELERELERERKRRWQQAAPPRRVEKVRGITV